MLKNSTLLKTTNAIALLILAVAALILSLKYSNVETNSDDVYQKAFNNHYRIFSPQIPKSISFSGEKVPIDEYYVRESIDRELLTNVFWQSNLLLLIKRSYRYFPEIEPILKAENVPADFKYLALIESSFTNVVSPAGASGFWQFMKPAATKHGLEISEEVDERYNLKKATMAACQYLKSSNKQFNSWTCAAAAYNMGDAGLQAQISKQKQTNYWELLLNQETARYLARIIAVKIIFESPKQYGIYLRLKDRYQPIPTREVIVDYSIANLVDFAIQQKTTYRILKEFNPWLRGNSLTIKQKKSYTIQLPKDGYTLYSKQISTIPNDFLLYKDTLGIDEIR
jgi:hypothetical protein